MQIHSRKMNVSPDVNYEELARCTEDFNGAQCKAVCVEAGMIALRNENTELKHNDYMDAILEVQAKKKKELNYYGGPSVPICLHLHTFASARVGTALIFAVCLHSMTLETNRAAAPPQEAPPHSRAPVRHAPTVHAIFSVYCDSLVSDTFLVISEHPT